VRAKADEVQELLSSQVAIAGLNAEKMTVLSGDTYSSLPPSLQVHGTTRGRAALTPSKSLSERVVRNEIDSCAELLRPHLNLDQANPVPVEGTRAGGREPAHSNDDHPAGAVRYGEIERKRVK
jgi:hypothetical protein